jgi:hypothetical protein
MCMGGCLMSNGALCSCRLAKTADVVPIWTSFHGQNTQRDESSPPQGAITWWHRNLPVIIARRLPPAERQNPRNHRKPSWGGILSPCPIWPKGDESGFQHFFAWKWCWQMPLEPLACIDELRRSQTQDIFWYQKRAPLHWLFWTDNWSRVPIVGFCWSKGAIKMNLLLATR